MSTKSSRSVVTGKRHDRSALIQWLALVVVAVLGIIAAFVLFDGDGGGQSGAPAVVHQV